MRAPICTTSLPPTRPPRHLRHQLPGARGAPPRSRPPLRDHRHHPRQPPLHLLRHVLGGAVVGSSEHAAPALRGPAQRTHRPRLDRRDQLPGEERALRGHPLRLRGRRHRLRRAALGRLGAHHRRLRADARHRHRSGPPDARAVPDGPRPRQPARRRLLGERGRVVLGSSRERPPLRVRGGTRRAGVRTHDKRRQRLPRPYPPRHRVHVQRHRDRRRGATIADAPHDVPHASAFVHPRRAGRVGHDRSPERSVRVGAGTVHRSEGRRPRRDAGRPERGR